MSEDTSRLGGGGDPRVLAERYVLRGAIGSGGMAEVELADDTVLDRKVAIKMLHGRYADDPSFLARFRREAQSAASLNHPNIVGVYDTGSSDGRSYIVMEYVSGRSLRDVLRQEVLSANRAAEIAADVAEALHYAHERGLVHRDVKPGNIMVSDEGQVKVTDFGIARALNAETVTQTAAVFGTAAYVSPEQAQGDPVDRRTDVYSLGCVLYEMLTGSQPFAGESAVTLAYKHVSEPPMPPSRIDANVSPELEAVTLRALAKDPADRYQTADEFAADLRRAVAGFDVTAPLGAGAYATTRYLDAGPQTEQIREEYREPQPEPEQRNRGLGVFLAVLLLGLGVLAAVLVFDLLETSSPARVEVPDVEGLNITEATTRLANAGFDTEAREEADPQVAEDVVIRTDPPKGSTAEEGSTVVIFYSGGPDLATVPQLRDEPVENAVQELADRGFSIGTRSRESNEAIDRGNVIRTDPAAGSEEPVGTEVDIVVSDGPELLTLPSVVGEDLDDALAELNDFCGDPACVIVVEADPVFSETYDENVVVNQDPPGGTEVRHGSSVTVTRSKGPPPEEEEEEEVDGGSNSSGGGNGSGGGNSSGGGNTDSTTGSVTPSGTPAGTPLGTGPAPESTPDDESTDAASDAERTDESGNQAP